MRSAFGVDHGEVSKGVVRFRMIKKPPRLNQNATPKMGPSKTDKIRGGLSRAGDADISLKGIGRGIGGVVRNTGRQLEKYPGTTGTAVVGGAGAYGYKKYNEKPKKKR